MWRVKQCELIRDGGSYAVTITDHMHEVSLWLQIERSGDGALSHGGLFFARGTSAAPISPNTRRVSEIEEGAWLDALRGATTDEADARTRDRLTELIEVLAARSM